MDLVSIIERIGEPPTAALLGLMTGAVFGVVGSTLPIGSMRW